MGKTGGMDLSIRATGLKKSSSHAKAWKPCILRDALWRAQVEEAAIYLAAPAVSPIEAA
jgi:hypothetical protein